MIFPYEVKIRTEGKNGWDVQVLPEPIASKPEFVVVVALSIKTLLERYTNGSSSYGARQRLWRELVDLLEDLHHQGIIVPKTAKKEKDEGTPYLDYLGHGRLRGVTKKA